VIEVRPVYWNAPSPILVTLLGIVIDAREVHPENRFGAILVTPLERVTDVSELQDWNALDPIIVPLSMVTDCTVEPKNAPLAMLAPVRIVIV